VRTRWIRNKRLHRTWYFIEKNGVVHRVPHSHTRNENKKKKGYFLTGRVQLKSSTRSNPSKNSTQDSIMRRDAWNPDGFYPQREDRVQTPGCETRGKEALYSGGKDRLAFCNFALLTKLADNVIARKHYRDWEGYHGIRTKSINHPQVSRELFGMTSQASMRYV